MPTSKEDRRVGKLLPSPVTPASTVCFTIQIPDAVPYRAALFGVLGQLGEWWTWDHPTDGTVCVDCEEAAQLWRDAIAAATFSDDCEMNMTCLDVADCIESNPAAQNAVGTWSGGTPLFGQPYAPGQPLTPSQMNAQLNAPDECGFDVLWSQCDQYVEFMIDLGSDAFERLQLYTEALATGKNAVGGQFIAKLKNGSSVGKVTEFLNWAVGFMKDAYESADTLDNRNALKCALFCAMRDDCLITIQGTLDVLNTRLGGVLSPTDLDSLPALADAMMTITFNPALAMDLWVLFLMGTAKTAGLFGVQGIDETVQLVLAVAVNDANNDWELLCDECNEPPGEMLVTFDSGGYPYSLMDGTITSAGMEGNGLLTRYYTYDAASGIDAMIEVDIVEGPTSISWFAQGVFVGGTLYFVNVYFMDSESNLLGQTSANYTIPSTWTQHSINLPALPTGTTKIGFRPNTSYGGQPGEESRYMIFDDVLFS